MKTRYIIGITSIVVICLFLVSYLLFLGKIKSKLNRRQLENMIIFGIICLSVILGITYLILSTTGKLNLENFTTTNITDIIGTPTALIDAKKINLVVENNMIASLTYYNSPSIGTPTGIETPTGIGTPTGSSCKLLRHKMTPMASGSPFDYGSFQFVVDTGQQNDFYKYLCYYNNREIFIDSADMITNNRDELIIYKDLDTAPTNNISGCPKTYFAFNNSPTQTVATTSQEYITYTLSFVNKIPATGGTATYNISPARFITFSTSTNKFGITGTVPNYSPAIFKLPPMPAPTTTSTSHNTTTILISPSITTTSTSPSTTTTTSTSPSTITTSTSPKTTTTSTSPSTTTTTSTSPSTTTTSTSPSTTTTTSTSPNTTTTSTSPSTTTTTSTSPSTTTTSTSPNTTTTTTTNLTSTNPQTNKNVQELQEEIQKAIQLRIEIQKRITNLEREKLQVPVYGIDTVSQQINKLKTDLSQLDTGIATLQKEHADLIGQYFVNLAEMQSGIRGTKNVVISDVKDGVLNVYNPFII